MTETHSLIAGLLGLTLLCSLAGCNGAESVQTVSPMQTPTLHPITSPIVSPILQPTLPPTPNPSPVPSPQRYATPEWPPYEDEPFTIVFQHNGELWASEVGGRREWPLTNEGLYAAGEGPYFGVYSFAVSPDGQSVLYVVTGQHNEYVKLVNILDGSTRVLGVTSEPYRVLRFGHHYSRSLAWWDDTHIAYYVFEPPLPNMHSTSPIKDLVVVDLETGESTVEPFSAFQYPSPDGRYVLSGPPYRLLDRETGEERVVVEEDDDVSSPLWSPDSQRLLFSLYFYVEDSERVYSSVLLVVDVETGTRWEVTPNDKLALYATWSPDGQTIAYLQCDPPGDACMNPELRLTGPEGTNQRPIPMESPTHCTELSWTPDGSRLVFEASPVSLVRENIWSIRLNGTDLRPVAYGYGPQVLPTP